MDVLIEIFGNSGELGNERQSVHDYYRVILVTQELILGDDAEAIRLDKLLSELLGALGAEHESGYQGNSNWNRLGVQVLKGVESQVDDVCLRQASTNFIHLSLIHLLVERNVEDFKNLDDHLLCRLITSSTFGRPFLDTE